MIRLLTAVVAVVVASSGSARAEDMPHQLSAELIQTEHENCHTSTGYGVNFVVQRDVDGDGRRDVILDYSQAQCGGQPEPYCAAGGCMLKVYLGGKGGGYRKVFDGRVKTWRLDETGGRPVLLIDGAPLAK
jgi:hypothetical protein